MKKKLTVLMLCAVLCLLTAACGQKTVLPGEFPMELEYSSGAGAWRTTLTLNADGTFEGYYSDSDMGDTDTDYPNGTVYECHFKGRFEAQPPNGANATPLILTKITTDEEIGLREIKDGVRHVYSAPFGFYGSDGPSESFTLYQPTTPIAAVNESLLRQRPTLTEDPSDTLDFYVLWNPEMLAAFFAAP